MQDFYHNAADVGARVRIVRKRNRLTQQAMAEALSMSVSNYSKIEVGARKLNMSGLDVLTRKFSIDPQWVLHGQGQEPHAQPPMVVKETGAAYPQKRGDQRREAVGTVRRALDVLSEQLGLPRDELTRHVLDLLIRHDKGGGGADET